MFRKKEDVPATDGVRRVAATELEVNNASRDGVYAFSIAVFLVSFAVVFALTWVWFSPVTVAVSLAVAFLCVSSVRMVPQWERAVVLRFGKFDGEGAGGLFLHSFHRVGCHSYRSARYDFVVFGRGRFDR